MAYNPHRRGFFRTCAWATAGRAGAFDKPPKAVLRLLEQLPQVLLPGSAPRAGTRTEAALRAVGANRVKLPIDAHDAPGYNPPKYGLARFAVHAQAGQHNSNIGERVSFGHYAFTSGRG